MYHPVTTLHSRAIHTLSFFIRFPNDHFLCESRFTLFKFMHPAIHMRLTLIHLSQIMRFPHPMHLKHSFHLIHPHSFFVSHAFMQPAFIRDSRTIHTRLILSSLTTHALIHDFYLIHPPHFLRITLSGIQPFLRDSRINSYATHVLISSSLSGSRIHP
jgi:hypothetical protein